MEGDGQRCVIGLPIQVPRPVFGDGRAYAAYPAPTSGAEVPLRYGLPGARSGGVSAHASGPTQRNAPLVRDIREVVAVNLLTTASRLLYSFADFESRLRPGRGWKSAVMARLTVIRVWGEGAKCQQPLVYAGKKAGVPLTRGLGWCTKQTAS